MLNTVNSDGLVSMVHNPNFDINTELEAAEQTLQQVYLSVNQENMNYFKVKWNGSGEYPNAANQCANNACVSVDSSCLCDIEVTESTVFTSMPSREQILQSLKVGHAHPASFDDGVYINQSNDNDVEFYTRNGSGTFSKHSVFGVMFRGKMTYFKNVESTVIISGNTGTTYEFRNPPHFLNVGKPESRDAIYETEAVLDHYFYHPNTAPFLATRMIKRFGFSNPSPRYVNRVAQAFTTGKYTKSKVKFGDGKMRFSLNFYLLNWEQDLKPISPFVHR